MLLCHVVVGTIFEISWALRINIQAREVQSVYLQVLRSCLGLYISVSSHSSSLRTAEFNLKVSWNT